MTHESPLDRDWLATVARFGGAEHLETEARETGAFRRARAVKCGVDLLRLTLAYCLGTMGLRLTAAWAEAIGLASLSNVPVLKRLRHMAPWLEILVARCWPRPRQDERTDCRGPPGSARRCDGRCQSWP